MSVVLALLASLFLGIGDFLGGTVSRTVKTVTVLLLAQVVVVLATLPRLLLHPMGADIGPALAWGAVSGVSIAVGVSALFKGLALGTMGVVAPLTALNVFIPVGAGMLGGERLGPLLVAGMAVAILGTFLASGPEFSRGSGAGRPIVLALVAAVGIGFANLTMARGSAHDVSAMILANSLATLVIYGVAALVLRTVPVARGRTLLGIVAIGVLGFGGNLSFALASEIGMLSVVAVCASVFPAVTVLLGWWFLKERLLGVQVLGVVLVLTGAAVVAVVA